MSIGQKGKRCDEWEKEKSNFYDYFGGCREMTVPNQGDGVHSGAPSP